MKKIILVSSNINYYQKSKDLFFSLVDKEKTLENFDIRFIVGGCTEPMEDYSYFKFVKYNSFDFTALIYAIDNNINDFVLLHDTVIITDKFLDLIKDIKNSCVKLAEFGWSCSMGNYNAECIQHFLKNGYNEVFNTSTDEDQLQKIKLANLKFEDYFTFRYMDMHPFPQEEHGNKRNCTYLGRTCTDIDKTDLKHLIPDIEKINRKFEYFDCGLYKLKANYSGATKKFVITL